MSRGISRRHAFSLLGVLLVAGAATALSPTPTHPAVVVTQPSSAPTIVTRPALAVPLPAPLRVPTTLPALRVVRQSHGPSRIAGVVRHTDGTPAADAVVTYFFIPGQTSDDEERSGTSTTTTAADGAFDVDVGPGDYGLYASDETRGSTVLWPISVSPGEAVTELELGLDGRSVVSGVVVDEDGKPRASGLRVSLLSPRVMLVGIGTDARGRFRVAHLPSAPLRLASFGLHESEGRRELSLPEDDVVVRLGPWRGGLVCEVVDWRGDAVAGVTVSGGFATARTDADGRARLTGLSGKVTITVESASGSAAPVHVVADGSEQTVRIRIEHAATVDGRVIDNAGHLAAGTVTIDDGRGLTSERELVDGTYSFEGVRSGRYTLAYSATGVPDASVSLAFSTDGLVDVTLADLRLPAPRTIRGRVLDDSGEPVSGADLDVVSLADGMFGDVGLQTDDRGRFEVAVLGKTRLRASREGATSAPLLLAGSGDEEVTLVLESDCQLEGLVRGASRNAEVRCADGVWHPLGATGQYQLSCNATATIEVRDAGTTRSFAVDFDPDETSYAEIRWSPP